MRLFFIGSDAGKIGSVLFCVQLCAHAAQAAVQVPPDQRFNGIQVFSRITRKISRCSLSTSGTLLARTTSRRVKRE